MISSISLSIDKPSILHSITYKNKPLGFKALDATLYLIRTAGGYPKLKASQKNGVTILTSTDQKAIHVFWRFIAGLIALTLALPFTLIGMAIKPCLMDMQKKKILAIFKEIKAAERGSDAHQERAAEVVIAVPQERAAEVVIAVPQERRDRATWLASINHELFTIQPLVHLVQSYLGLGYLVEINNYAIPNTGNDYDRYLAIPRFKGVEYGLLQQASSYSLHVQLTQSYNLNPLEIIKLNNLSLSGCKSMIPQGALDPANISYILAYIKLLKVLENDQFREPFEGEKINIESLLLVPRDY